MGVGADDGPRYWGTREGRFIVINDIYRSKICLIYPPHLIAIAAICIPYCCRPPPFQTRNHTTSRSTATSSTSAPAPLHQPHALCNPTNILIKTLTATIMQETISFWSLRDKYKEAAADTAFSAFTAGSDESGASTSSSTKSHRVGKSMTLPAISGSSSASSSLITPSVIGTSQDEDCDDDITGQGQGRGQGREVGGDEGAGEDTVVVTSATLSNVLVKMREGCMTSIVQAGGQTVNASGTINI